MSLTRRSFLQGVVAGGAAWSAGCLEADEPTPSRTERQPAYHELEAKGELAERVDRAYRILEKCELCPRRCGVNRRKGQRGFCRASDKLMVYSHHPHFGEELPLVGRHGSGTLFFSHCNLRCVFCQNWPIAHQGRGQKATDPEVADMMIRLQERGCHNINVVTPTHVMPNILAATRLALHKGLRLPLVYNTGGYEHADIIRRLEGVVGIYMPDLKFMDDEESARYLHARDYPAHAQAAIREMYRQVGPLQVDDRGLAVRGLMIRHLVMPNRTSNAKAFVQWVAETLCADVYVNIMAQYRVDYRAFDYPDIARAITAGEFVEAMEWAEAAGLRNLDARSVSQRNVQRRRM